MAGGTLMNCVLAIFNFINGPDFLVCYVVWFLVTWIGMLICRSKGHDTPMTTAIGLALFELVGLFRMWEGTAHGMHKWNGLVTMMTFGAFFFILRASSSGDGSDGGGFWSSCSGSSGCGGGGGCGGGERLWRLWRFMMIGLGYRHELSGWIDTKPHGVDCLEITAEHFYQRGEKRLAQLAGQFKLFVHGLGLSLGTAGPLDRDRLEQFARISAAANPEWVSEHIAFTRTADADLGHLNPVRPTRDAVKIIADHAREVSERCRKPILLENITSHLQLEGELTETEFLNEVCAQAGCGLLLDVTNLFINSRNHQFDPHRWLRELEPGRIRQLHLVGYSLEGDRYTDNHAQPIQAELIELAPGRGRILCPLLPSYLSAMKISPMRQNSLRKS